MFSNQARRRYVERGGGVGAAAAFVCESLTESFSEARRRGDIARSFARTAAATTVATFACLAPAFGLRFSAEYLTLVAGTGTGAAVLTSWSLLFARLFVDEKGTPLRSAGAANHLTLIRLCLIAPVAILLIQGRPLYALAVYGVLALTDVADGIVARTAGPRSSWGVVMDPLADVLSTAAVYVALWATDLVPAWLVVLLGVRYVMLIAGSVALFLTAGPFTYRATLPGKIVGVFQALGAAALVVAQAIYPSHVTALGRLLYPFLGLCFASIVVSQAVIGLRWFRGRGMDSR